MAKGRGGIAGKVSRRGFLGAAGAGLGSAWLASELGAGRVLAAEAGNAKGAEPKAAANVAIPRRKLGRTGAEVTILSNGGMTDFTQNQLLLSTAWKLGLNHWDTAAGYNDGKSEQGYGQFFAKHPGVRKQLFLVTKCGDVNPQGMEKSLNRSLKRLQTDWVDLIFFHGMDKIDSIDKAELKAWAESAKKAKKIRFIGFSAHENMATMLSGAAKLGWIDVVMMTYNYRIMHEDDMKRAVDECVKANVGLTAMKTQGGGQIANTPEDRALAGHFVEKGYTAEQAKIKAVLEDERIATVCSQMPTIDILKANVAAVTDRKKLDASDRRALDRHAAATCGTACAACGRCARALAGAVPVPAVMRHLMYARQYGEQELASGYVRSLPAAVRVRMANASFARAERVCPNGLPIGRLMKEAVIELG